MPSGTSRNKVVIMGRAGTLPADKCHGKEGGRDGDVREGCLEASEKTREVSPRKADDMVKCASKLWRAPVS